MIHFLARKLIRDYNNVSDAAVRRAYGVLCGAVGIVLNLLLFAGKALAGIISGSIAITADAFNNLSDAGSSVVTLLGFKLAAQKPDSHHPFGHGRMEYVSGLVVSMVILLMGVELAKTSVEKIITPGEVDFSPVVVGILIASIAVKLYMAAYNRLVSKKIDSSAMAATATDSLSDCLATSAVLLSTLAGHFWDIHIDGWCGAAVACFILWAGVNAARETINPLLGQPPEPEFVDQIRRIVLSHPDVLGMHDLIVHNYGPGRVMISLHAEVSARGDILRLHDTIDNIERELQTQLRCSAVIHMDPIENDDEETKKQKKAVLDILSEIDPKLTMHDFRIVQGPTHTNLIFDVLVPYGFSIGDARLKAEIESQIRKKNPEYYAVINIDKDYT